MFKPKKLFQNAKNLYLKLKSTTQKTRDIALPFLKETAKEKLDLPLIHKQMTKGLFFTCAFIGVHILEFYTTYFFFIMSTQDNKDKELLSENPEDLSVRFKYFIFPAGNFLLTTAIMCMKRSLTYHLRMSLEVPLKESMLKSWLTNNAMIGLALLQECEKEKLLPVHDLFGSHVSTFSRESIAITVDTCSDITSMLITLYHLGRVYNPDLLAFTTFYALAMGLAIHKIFNKNYSDLYSALNLKESAITSQIENLQRRGNQTVSFQAEMRELEKLRLAIREREGMAKKNLTLDLKSEFVVGSFGQMLYPTLMALFPHLHKEYYVNRNMAALFSGILNVFINKTISVINRYNQDLSKFEQSLEQIDKFNQLVKKWQDFNDLKLLQQRYQSDSQNLIVRNLKVHIPSKKRGENINKVVKTLRTPNLLWGKDRKGISIEFQKGKVYLFSDESGLGKTTVLKSIIGMFPFSSGNITFPCRPEEIQYITGNSLNPCSESLLDAITYPHIPIEMDERLVRKFIDEMKLVNAQELKENLKDKNWGYFDALSTGQKACCAIMGILIRKPKVLFLDEPLNGLDLLKKTRVEQLIKLWLPNTIIIYADHHPINGFADFEVRIKDRQLICLSLSKVEISTSYKGGINEKSYGGL